MHTQIFILWSGLLAVQASVLIPTYALPPYHLAKSIRDQRSLPTTRTLARLAGGHLKLHTLQNKDNEKTADYSKNNFALVNKEASYQEVIYKNDNPKTEESGADVNKGEWDDGMFMSSAGNGKEKGKSGKKDDDDEKKTLADQVAEGKYGLIQKELFIKNPTRPGVVSYMNNPETESKDNQETLGGLKNDDIWLAEDHLLVLKGGAFPEHGPKPGTEGEAWPAIDDYQAPLRQVKIPSNPEVPPPFPVRLSDGGPLVFLTPNGSVPAALFPPESPGEGYGAVFPETFAIPSPYSAPPQSVNKKNTPTGRAPLPISSFPFLPGNISEGPFPFPESLNDGTRLSLPPGAVFLPPPPARENLTDLYDEDDPSIYYPPPYSFSYKPENISKIPAGPLVPGIVLPPPPDFFAPLDGVVPTTTIQPTDHVNPPTSGAPPTVVLRPRPTVSSTYLPVKSDNNAANISSTPPTKTYSFRPTQKKPTKVILIPKSQRKPYTTSLPLIPTSEQNKTFEKKRPSVTIIQKPLKTTLKPVPETIYYSNKNNYLDENTVSPPSPQPFLIYGPPESIQRDKQFVTSTPVPLTAYYSDDVISQIQFAKQNAPNTRIRPEFYSPKQNGKSVASFYFYEEPVTKPALTTPAPQTYYDDNIYYQSLSNGEAPNDYYYNSGQKGFIPSSNLELQPFPSREPSAFFFVPQRQGSRTLTQEYFSINQNRKPQSNTLLNSNYVQQQVYQQNLQPQPVRHNSFYDQIANIQKTIDYYTTHKPKTIHQNVFREVRQKARPTPRPVYQFSYQSNNVRPDHNTFRVPKMDPEPFRPMVPYSKPYNVENEYSTTPQTNFPEENQSVTELPQPTKYYTTTQSQDYDYGELTGEQIPQSDADGKIIPQSPVIKKGKRIQYYGPTTSNPINHAYYTKQEENLFDDITKNYFTIFGQKIENGNRDVQGIAVTTPLRPVEISTAKTPINHNIVQCATEEECGNYRATAKPPPLSLENDINVNYNPQRPDINPDSEFIPIVNPQIQAKYEAEKQREEQMYHKQKVQNVQIIKSEPVNQQINIPQYTREQGEYYRRPYQGNYQIQQQRPANNGIRVAEGRPGSLITYRLPGEGAHVYFLTPQPARPENSNYRNQEISTLR